MQLVHKALLPSQYIPTKRLCVHPWIMYRFLSLSGPTKFFVFIENEYAICLSLSTRPYFISESPLYSEFEKWIKEVQRKIIKIISGYQILQIPY